MITKFITRFTPTCQSLKLWIGASWHYCGYILCKHIGIVWGSIIADWCSIYFQFIRWCAMKKTLVNHAIMVLHLRLHFATLFCFVHYLPYGSMADCAGLRMGMYGKLLSVNKELVLPQTKLKDADRVEVRFSPHITWDNLQVGYYLLSLCIMRPCCSNLCCKYDFWCNKFKCIHRLLHFNHWRWFFWDSIRWWLFWHSLYLQCSLDDDQIFSLKKIVKI
jgi:hypothetical protein